MIHKDEIIRYSEMIKNGASVEKAKLELKREWWNFDEPEVNEFIKDTTAMANTYGDIGYFIIGLDGTSGELSHSPVPIDSSKIKAQIYKRTNEPFNIEVYEYEIDGKVISIIEVPISLNKPHMIKQFVTKKGNIIQNYIPVRKSTSVYPADKADLDLMYFERRPEVKKPYNLNIYTRKRGTFRHDFFLTRKRIGVPINVVNDGTNINFVFEFAVILYFNDEEIDRVKGVSLKLDDSNEIPFNQGKAIKIPSNDLLSGIAFFEFTEEQLEKHVTTEKIYNYTLRVIAYDCSNNEVLSTPLAIKKQISP